MVSFEGFRLTGGIPVYQQILLYIQRGAVAGRIRDGDELPSRRQLSALLGVNPNTVQKAFHLLEEAGLICSRTGAKSCMTLDEAALARLRRELLTQDMRAVTRALRQAGVAREEALALLAGFWEEDSE